MCVTIITKNKLDERFKNNLTATNSHNNTKDAMSYYISLNINNIQDTHRLYFIQQEVVLLLTRTIPRDFQNVFLKVSDTCFYTP
jgi:hypothetical protein